MSQHARSPDSITPPSAENRMTTALSDLSRVITELIHLSAEHRAVTVVHLEVLRTRRAQLSAVLDALDRFTRP